MNVVRYDPLWADKIRREFSLEGKTVIGHIGRFNKQKNHAFLLEVFAKIHQSNPNVVLLLVGKGELEQQICQQAQQLGVENSVIFTGVRQDVPALLSAMDVMVFPSFYEGMPNVIIEAQATGLHCVVADTITKTANISGLVEYLSLSKSAQEWADCALSKVDLERKNMNDAFIKHQYDIQSVANVFKTLIWGDKEAE